MMHWDLGPLPAPRALLLVSMGQKYSSSSWRGKDFDETTLCTVRGWLFTVSVPRRKVVKRDPCLPRWRDSP